MYILDGDRLLVIASNAGAATHPDWYRNVVAHPEVTVEVRNETFKAIAIHHHRGFGTAKAVDQGS
jgi:deazaflavin-dependent oxidoreductase (nitroreductase family)